MYKKCEEILNKLESEGKIKISNYQFPPKQELKLRLKDMLEDEVDEKYYLSDTQVNRIKTSTYISSNRRIQEKDWCDTLCTRDWEDPKCIQVASLPYFSYESDGCVYSPSGINPSLRAKEPNNKIDINDTILIKNATRQGYLEAHDGDSINLAYPESKTRRGRVGEQVSQTLQTSDNMGVVVDKPRKDIKEVDRYCEYCGNKLERKRFNGRLEDFTVFSNRKYCNRECMRKDWVKIGDNHNQTYSNAHTTARKINELILHNEMCELCGSDTNLDIHHIDGNWQNNNLDNLMCLCRSCHTKYERNKDKNELRIRKLTPLEFWRLMGFDDEDFDKASKVNSNTQLYKQAGNSIVVTVLEAIFKELFSEYIPNLDKWSDLD